MPTLLIPRRVDAVRPATSARVAFAYSTKDRTAFTRRTVARLADAPGFDLFWLDGSSSDAGRSLPAELAPELPNLCEIHYDVVGGADAAIVYALTTLLERGYDFIGLIENDVLLEPGWFEALRALFAQGEADGWPVGAVSARSYHERLLFPGNGYGVMWNLGAGMILMRREAVQAVLARYRTASFIELRQLYARLAETDIGQSWEIGQGDHSRLWATADWFFDASLALDGWCSLALTPARSTNIDVEQTASMGIRTIEEALPPLPATDPRPGIYQARLRALRAQDRSSLLAATRSVHHSAAEDFWLIFPHQLAAALPSAFKGDWVFRWSKCFGPFLWEAREAGASLELELQGPWCGLIMGRGPGHGRARLQVDAHSIDLALEQPKNDLFVYDARLEPERTYHLKLEATAPGVRWYGLQTREIPAWLPTRSRFGLPTLPFA